MWHDTGRHQKRGTPKDIAPLGAQENLRLYLTFFAYLVVRRHQVERNTHREKRCAASSKTSKRQKKAQRRATHKNAEQPLKRDIQTKNQAETGTRDGVHRKLVKARTIQRAPGCSAGQREVQKHEQKSPTGRPRPRGLTQ